MIISRIVFLVQHDVRDHDPDSDPVVIVVEVVVDVRGVHCPELVSQLVRPGLNQTTIGLIDFTVVLDDNPHCLCQSLFACYDRSLETIQ